MYFIGRADTPDEQAERAAAEERLRAFTVPHIMVTNEPEVMRPHPPPWTELERKLQGVVKRWKKPLSKTYIDALTNHLDCLPTHLTTRLNRCVKRFMEKYRYCRWSGYEISYGFNRMSLTTDVGDESYQKEFFLNMAPRLYDPNCKADQLEFFFTNT